MTDEITLDAPETRLERFLAAAAGVEGITLDEPQTRIEKYLYKIAQGGGSGGGVSVVTVDETGTLDKTWQELFDATFSVIPISQSDSMTLFLVFYVFERVPLGGGDTEYVVKAFNHDNVVEFVASSADGYPVIDTD